MGHGWYIWVYSGQISSGQVQWAYRESEKGRQYKIVIDKNHVEVQNDKTLIIKKYEDKEGEDKILRAIQKIRT